MIFYSILFIFIILFGIWWLSSRKRTSPEFKKVDALLSNGNYDEAIKYLKETHNKDQTNIGILDLLGTILHNQEQHEEAISYLNKAIESSPHTPRFTIMLANCYYNTEQYDKAIEVLKPLMEKSGKDLRVIQLLGASYAAQKDYDEAIEVYKQGPIDDTPLDEELLDFHYNLGILYEGNGDLGMALEHFYKVYEADENYRDVAFILKELEDINK